MRLRVWGVPPGQLAPVTFGGPSYTLGEITAAAAPARHDVPGIVTEDAVGYLLDLGGVRLYHSGDTEYDHSMRALSSANIDVMLVCVNGTAGNMNAHEAALLAWQVRPRVVVPMHFGLWVDEGYTNLGGEATLDPSIFVDTYRKLGGAAEVIVPEIGQRIMVTARPTQAV
jgi:L-ascorbate metabolism protein UlaG (beta-lactamase superfamily)